MKKILQCLLGMLFMFGMLQQGYAQKKENKKMSSSKHSSQAKTMTWTTKSDEAKDLALQGADYFMNIEFPQAYEKFEQALKLDPNFTVALVFMTNLTQGEAKKQYAQRALKSAENKTEGEKLFASLVKDGLSEQDRRDAWAKLHDMFPDGAMISNFYVVTRATPEERFAAAQDYIAKFPDKPWMYNTIAYFYMQDKKDMENAKKNFEKYIELYPDGYNPYDSMGEYYMTAGDMDNSKKYYSMALEKYPFVNSSLTALEKINDKNKSDKKTVSNDQ